MGVFHFNFIIAHLERENILNEQMQLTINMDKSKL